MKTPELQNRAGEPLSVEPESHRKIDGPGERSVDPVSSLAVGRGDLGFGLAADAPSLHHKRRQTQSGQGEEDHEREEWRRVAARTIADCARGLM